jgi:hypothetical protein
MKRILNALINNFLFSSSIFESSQTAMSFKTPLIEKITRTVCDWYEDCSTLPLNKRLTVNV